MTEHDIMSLEDMCCDIESYATESHRRLAHQIEVIDKKYKEQILQLTNRINALEKGYKYIPTEEIVKYTESHTFISCVTGNQHTIDVDLDNTMNPDTKRAMLIMSEEGIENSERYGETN